jgi:diguanylate cyclase (GGDEF)-like protein
VFVAVISALSIPVTYLAVGSLRETSKAAGNAEAAAGALSEGAFVALCAVLLGAGVYLVFAALPRRLLERSLAEVELANALLKQREAELKGQNLRLDVALGNMVQGLAMFDAQERIVIANDRFAEMYGLTPDQVRPGTTLRRVTELRIATGLYVGFDVDHVIDLMRKRVARGTISHITSRLGDGRVYTVSIRPLPGGGWVTTHQDITEREQLNARLEQQNALLQEREDQLAAQNRRFQAAMRYMSQGLCLFDAEQRVVLANDRYAEIYNLTAEQTAPGTTLRQILELRAANGCYANVDMEQFVTDGVTSFHREVSEIIHLADGRYISVLRRPMPDGGLVSTHEDVTEREKLKLRLAQQNEQLDAALNNMSQGLAMFDDEQRIVVCNDRYREMYALTPELGKPGTYLRQILQHRLANGSHTKADPSHFIDDVVAEFNSRSNDIHELADGRIIRVQRRETASGGLVVTHEDITDTHRLNAQLEANNKLLGERTSRLQTIIDNFPGGIAFLDADLRFVICNDNAKKLLGVPDELFDGGSTSIEDVFRHIARSGELGPGDVEDLVAARMAILLERKPHVLERTRSNGIVLEIRGEPLEYGGFIITFTDITERRRSQAKIAHMAMHDALTGLANRVLYNERLEQALTRVKRGEMVAVHLLDLDHFKHVNDTLGHPAGDKLLKDAAERLRALVRECDTIARMGGDEFAVLQVGIGQPAGATVLAQRIIEALCQPFQIDGRQVVVGTSVGIAIGPADGLASDELMRNADLALYRAKGDGRGTYRFFEADMDAEMRERRMLEQDLRKALPAGEFELHYQPTVNLETGSISGFEALLRWRHPEKGVIAPASFIPLAEEIGFIVPLGEWVIRQACATAAGWPAHTRVSVNLSPVQFRSSGLPEVVVSALATSGLAPDRLELEITESALLENNDATLDTLYRLRELGVRIAMDDFGTGYSSLGYLQSFPFDRIKIDRSFIKDVAEGVGSLNIVRAVSALAKGLGMETTAEGVETSAQRDTVRSEGCTEMQGFLFSRPRPAHEIEQLLQQEAAAQPGREASVA